MVFVNSTFVVVCHGDPKGWLAASLPLGPQWSISTSPLCSAEGFSKVITLTLSLLLTELHWPLHIQNKPQPFSISWGAHISWGQMFGQNTRSSLMPQVFVVPDPSV